MSLAFGCVAALLVALAAGSPDTLHDSKPVQSTAPPNLPQETGSVLVGELGCPACHPGLAESIDPIRSRAPSLESAGGRFQASYLFSYLLHPDRVRRHIGASRMPDFRLDERESLALTLYLQSMVTTPSLPSHLSELLTGRSRGARRDAEELITGELGCVACHTLRGIGGETAPELLDTGSRLQREWLTRYVAAPALMIPGTPMPSVFFDWDESGTPHPRFSDATARLSIVLEYLVASGEDKRREQERAFERVRRANSDITAEIGHAIFRALNCAGCHVSPMDPAVAVGPDLSKTGRLRADWLAQYVRHPTAIRPFGFYPGTGSRMPDFALSSTEADSIAAYLTRTADQQPNVRFEPAALTAFGRDEALRLIRDKFACLGCHRLDGEGGRIGPDLTGVAARLTPGAIYSTLQAPQRLMPQSVMPQQPMPDNRLRLIASYLTEHVTPTSETSLPLTEHALTRPGSDPTDGHGLYERYCASCHGIDGNGDGYNAPYLPVSPTQHADSSYMSTRPDDTLFDGIHAGGHILGRSHRMPGFGQRLEPRQIRAIVAYIRELCRCEAPLWSRDGVRR